MFALLTISALGVLAMIAGMLRIEKGFLYPLLFLGLVIAFVDNMVEWHMLYEHYNLDYPFLRNMMRYDDYSFLFNAVLIAIAIGWFLLAPSLFDDKNHFTDYFAVVLFALAGAVILTSFNNLVMLFLGIEILSISMYVMAGSKKTDLRSNEAALKYFLMGAFATGFLLFGITLVYGATHTFYMEATPFYRLLPNGKTAFTVLDIRHFVIDHQGNIPAIFSAGILLIMVGLLFKISAFPFHFWAPDVYEGSPTPITAYMSTIVKVAAVAAFFRLFYTCFAVAKDIWIPALWFISALTILVGNYTALYQKDLKRMLAYSSVSHAGYLILAILAMNSLSAPALMYYSIAYSFATLAAFAVLIIVSKRTGDTHIASLKGLSKQNPFLAGVMVVSMFSLAGIPPLAGFFAKYYLFSAALQSHFVSLVIIAIIGSLAGIYYYFRVVVTLFQEGHDHEPYSVSGTHIVLLVLCLLVLIILGIFPDLLIRLW